MRPEDSGRSNALLLIDFMLEEILKTLKQSISTPLSLTEIEHTIICYMREDAGISAKQIAERSGKSARQIENYIAALKEKGVIQREGARKNGKWKVQFPLP